jgi:hypothetical protein
MDWQAFADGMKTWIAKTTKIPLDDIYWEGEPLGMQGRPCARLNLLGSPGYGISDIALGSDEVRLVSQGPGQDALVRIVGNRAITLQTVVFTRDGTPWGRAFRYLERMRDALFLPSTQQLFSDLGIGLDGPSLLVDLNHVFDLRQESSASFELRLLYAFDTMCECGADDVPAETIGTIEHVRVSGKVGTPFSPGIQPVIVPERQIDKVEATPHARI